VGRHFNESEGKLLYEEFTAEAQPRNLMNCGACSACAHLMDMSQKYSRTGSAISHYGNFAETAERVFTLWIPVAIFWGALPDRAYAMAAGLARGGVVVIMGPASAFSFQRWCTGNKWDYQHWWEMETFGGKKRYVEPAPKHLIIPVETKEEAVTLAVSHLVRPTDLRDTRQIRLEAYVEYHAKFFGGLPDDLHLFISSDWELPLRYKGGILKWLREKRGWETERMKIKRARHPDGRLLPLAEFDQEYSARTRHVTKLPRLLAHEVAAAEPHQGQPRRSG
jgi:CO dehydrogenase/acetyl-CoA synthase alpha subunit